MCASRRIVRSRFGALEALEARRMLATLQTVHPSAPWIGEACDDVVDGDVSDAAKLEWTSEPVAAVRADAKDLAITAVTLVDANNVPIDAPVVGQMVFVRAEWTTSGLSANDQYIVRFWVDDIPIDSNAISGKNGKSLPYHWYRGGWFATGVQQQYRVEIDALKSVMENPESNNSLTSSFTAVEPTGFPERFVLPTDGQQGRDWTVMNFVDVDPKAGYQDYRGGSVSYNGHNAIDFTFSTFAAMDRGIPVYAATGGTVIDVQDGYYDRNWERIDPPPQANYVIIDHGNDWQTSYLHLRMNSIVVDVGDEVSAGQMMGLIGSSGRSSGPHLHFHVSYRDTDVETMFAPDLYWNQAPAYTFDLSPIVMEFGVTNEAPDYPTTLEQVSNVTDFSRDAGQRVYAWAIYSALQSGDVVKARMIKPNGELYWESPLAIGEDYQWSWWYQSRSLPNRPDAGTWRVEYYINDQPVGETAFQVTETGRPEMRLFAEDIYVIDGRTTPIDFGTSSGDPDATTRQFHIQNHGQAPLLIDRIDVPVGFTLMPDPPTRVPAGESRTFSVQLGSVVGGEHEGSIRILTNDEDEAVYDFRVVGDIQLVGDVTQDGQLNADDIDLLYEEVRSGRHLKSFDLTGDGRVNAMDVDRLIKRSLDIVYGDANLDGVFDSSDLVFVLRAGEYEDGIDNNSGWASGDWNGDREFDTGDLVFALQHGDYVTG